MLVLMQVRRRGMSFPPFTLVVQAPSFFVDTGFSRGFIFFLSSFEFTVLRFWELVYEAH